MRTLFALALLVWVGGCAEKPERPTTSGAVAPLPSGPDAIVLRVSRDGGQVSAMPYPVLDSAIWRSSYRVPPLARVLGYHADDGYLSAVDTSGRPVRLDLRLGAVVRAGSAGDRQHASADGAIIYALNTDGGVKRYTPVGEQWSLPQTRPPQTIVPLIDGSLVLVHVERDTLSLYRVRPPDTARVDSLRWPMSVAPESVRAFTVGDRLFVSAGSHVMALRTRDFVRDVDVELDATIEQVVSSPSGDRLFALTADVPAVQVVDRFAAKVVATIDLPARPLGLRMDPLGRVLLVRGAADEVWVVDVGTAQLVGALRSVWRDDLPLVLPDAAIALAQGDSVVVASSIDLGVVRTIANGANDSWFSMRWNGFRPRAEGLDQPVEFRTSSAERRTYPRADGGVALPGTADTLAGTLSPALPAPTAPAAPSAPSAPPAPAGAASAIGFTVQLAAVLTEELARAAAEGVTVDGRAARVSTSVRAGRTMYRVVLGPYPTREEAEAAGRETGRDYWVFEGLP